MKNNIPLSRPSIGREEIEAVTRVLHSGWVVHGPKNEELEALIKDYFGVKQTVVVNSGASALLLSLLALEVKGEVIVPSFTMSASVNAIILAGATPVFAEVEWETGNIDPKRLVKKITSRTQAIMPVHFAGQPCRMDEIMSIAKKYKLKVIEDSAECIGGKYKGKFAGTFGDVGCFSFWATKNITTGEGGAVLTNNEEVSQKVRLLVSHGIPTTTLEREKSSRPWFRDCLFPGFNMRMSNISAAIGVEQFKKLDRLNKARRQKAHYLREKLASVKEIDTLDEAKDVFHVYQMYVIRVKDIRKRDDYLHMLRERGIGASVHFDPPVHKQTYYVKKYGQMDLPVTEKLAKSVITLPLYPDINFADLDYIVENIKSVLG